MGRLIEKCDPGHSSWCDHNLIYFAFCVELQYKECVKRLQ